MDRHNDISQMDTRVFEISNGKNRHAVVLQFEIQATFGDGMGELRYFFSLTNLPDHAFNIKTLCRHNCINAFFRKFL